MRLSLAALGILNPIIAGATNMIVLQEIVTGTTIDIDAIKTTLGAK